MTDTDYKIALWCVHGSKKARVGSAVRRVDKGGEWWITGMQWIDDDDNSHVAKAVGPFGEVEVLLPPGTVLEEGTPVRVRVSLKCPACGSGVVGKGDKVFAALEEWRHAGDHSHSLADLRVML